MNRDTLGDIGVNGWEGNGDSDGGRKKKKLQDGVYQIPCHLIYFGDKLRHFLE